MFAYRTRIHPGLPALLLFAGIVVGTASAADRARPLSPQLLRNLVTQVAESDYGSQQDFAWIALSELTAAYEQVLVNSSLRLPRGKRAKRKLYSWRKGTQRFVASLHLLLERLNGSAELGLRIDDTGPPVLYIDRQPVVLSGPELGTARLMERRIFDAYCAIYDCSGILPQKEQERRMGGAPAGGRWWLQDYGRVSYRTGDGLICPFRGGVGDRQRKQQACERVAAELRELAQALEEAQLAGHLLDWEGLRVESLTVDSAQRVVLTPGGAHLRLRLPLLARVERLGAQLRHWLQRRTAGESAQAEIPAQLLQGIVAGMPDS